MTEALAEKVQVLLRRQLSPQSDGAQGIFGCVVVDCHAAVIDVHSGPSTGSARS
ncbi:MULTISPECIES: hypothetical protein [Burkholderia]|uniref:hypothetical protein n=1 Tax=Burkholderia TaxID=32008 RepID=UPI0015A573EC|nr:MULTISPECIES: hypothetical protein [Burkholderia]